MMRGDGWWEQYWSEANSRLVHNALKVGDEERRRYWDMRSVYYNALTQGDEGLRDLVIGYMAREQVLKPGDSVLEVGCGTGQYTLPMARAADRVTGLDVSGGMLDRMMKEAARQGADNVRPVCSAWEQFESEEKYDLVFSAFCPAVNDPPGLFKMERFSSRSCCFLTGGGIGQPAFIYELMELLTGRTYPPVNTDDFFSFNVLYEAGRKPSVRSFSYLMPPGKDKGYGIEHAVLYFDMLLGPDPARKDVIIDYFASHPEEEDDEEERERSLYAVCWHPDGH